MKKWIAIIVVLVLAAAGGYYYWVAQAASATETVTMETATLQSGDLSATISAIGKVRSRQSASLFWQTTGTVQTVNVKVGDTVSAGQELARLSETSLPQSVVSAQAELYNAQQALDELTTSAEKARITAMQNIVTYEQAVRDAQYDLDNFTSPSNFAGLSAVEAVNAMKTVLDEARAAFEPYKLYPSGNATRQALKLTLDLAQADYNTAVKRLGYEYDLEVAKNNLAEAYSDYEQAKDGPGEDEIAAAQARITAQEIILQQMWIEAPFAGTVTEANPLVGDRTASGDVAFRIDDLSTLYVDVSVSEIDVNQVQSGQAVTLTLDALRGRSYHGLVTAVALIGDDSSEVVNYQVTVQLSDPDAQVRPGMTSEVTIQVANRQNVLLIPNLALRLENSQTVVRVVGPGGQISSVPVTLGIANDSFSELLSGEVQAGAVVVVSQTETDSGNSFRMGPMGGGRPPDDGGERNNP